jgi:hypothetical protein
MEKIRIYNCNYFLEVNYSFYSVSMFIPYKTIKICVYIRLCRAFFKVDIGYINEAEVFLKKEISDNGNSLVF